MHQLRILCVPGVDVGHVNPMIGLVTAIRRRGHQVVVAVNEQCEGMFRKLGFDEELYSSKVEDDKDIAEICAETFRCRGKAVDQMKVFAKFFDMFFEQNKNINRQMVTIVNKCKPDVIIEDRYLELPALISAGCAFVKFTPINPLFCFDDYRLPPHFLGLPLNDSSEWQTIRQDTTALKKDNIRRLNEWLQSEDPSMPKRDPNYQYKSTNLNIFVYPKSVVEEYVKLSPLGDEWIGLDYSFEKPTMSIFEIPETLKNRPGKLIYFSMGTIGPAFVDTMRRLIALLSKLKHKFIVSKGHCNEEIELAENMWGDAYLPQLDILPHVDLVITHGGNNTFIESLYFGKPMIVIPLFLDQFDNAQRAVEMNIGRRFDVLSVKEDELSEAIDEMLSDSNTAQILEKISNEMQASDSMDLVIDRIEYIAKHPKFPTIK